MSKGSRRAFASGRVLLLRGEESGAAVEACLPPCGDTTQLDRCTTVNTASAVRPVAPAGAPATQHARSTDYQTDKLKFLSSYNLQRAY